MRSVVRVAAITLGIAVTMAVPIVAEEGAGRSPVYELSKEVTVRGMVTAVQQHAGWMGWDGVQVVLQTDAGAVEVQVAPKSFLDLMELEVKGGDTLEVTGSPAKTPDGDVLLAREVRKKNVVIAVRDKKGTPVW